MTAGLIVAFILGALAATWALHARAQWLASINFRIVYPSVPVTVTKRVREAEARYYAGRGILRRIAEEGEDILTFAFPSLTYALNLSVGPYRIKAKSIEEILPWAQQAGYLVLTDVPAHHVLQSIAYFSEQPALADWGAAVLLEHLRQRHPELAKRSWTEIERDDKLVAKLYSGYMGAGGDWAGWEATAEPGPEAKRRLQLKEG